MLLSRGRRLLLAAVLLAAFLLLYAVSNLTVAGQAAENSWARLYGPEQAAGWWVDEAHLPPFGFDRLTIVVGILLVIGIAAVRRRWRLLAVVAIATPVSIGATGAFKAVAARPRLVPSLDFDVSYPSGHAAIAFALTAALLVVVPRRHLRWCVPLLAGWSALVAAGLQSEGQHRASEILGSALLVAGVFAGTSAVLLPASTAARRLRPADVLPAAALAVLGAIDPVPWTVAVYAATAFVSVVLVLRTAAACREEVPSPRPAPQRRVLVGGR